MSVWSVITRWAFALALVVALGGCLPSSDSQSDEQKDPYYLAAMSYKRSLNFKGAVEYFEKALDANPRNASAHMELGALYEQKVQNENAPAIAIFHYTRFLQLRPESELAEFIREHIKACRTEIAKPIALTPGTAQSFMREMERLKAENAQLRTQLDAWARSAQQAAPAPGQIPVVQPPQQPVQPVVQPQPRPAPQGIAAVPPVRPPEPVPVAVKNTPQVRKHKVAAGETPATIARRYGVSADKLVEANPGLNPRRMRVGQELNIPNQ